PMEARLVGQLPEGEGWQFEPKWDGFRCLVIDMRGGVELRGRSGKSLTRYFPEVAARIAALAGGPFVLDGELVIPLGDALSFEALQLRLHPAESRIRRLARETPASLILFDCLVSPNGVLLGEPLTRRRAELESIFASFRSREGLSL